MIQNKTEAAVCDRIYGTVYYAAYGVVYLVLIQSMDF